MKRPPLLKYTLMQSSIVGVLLCAFVSLVPWYFPKIGGELAELSYDWNFRFKPISVPSKVVMVYVDEETYEYFHEAPKNFSRSHYADAIEYLTQEGAGLIALDVWFDPNVPPEQNRELVQAIRKSGKVVIAVAQEESENIEVKGITPRPPARPLLDARVESGIAAVVRSGSNIRQYYHGSSREPGFAWVAARMTSAPAVWSSEEPDDQLWLNYYGPPGTLQPISFAELKQQVKGFFKDRYVFIGSRPSTPYAKEPTDTFPTPYTRWNKAPMPGVEIAATAFLNLINSDGLHRMADPDEFYRLLMGALIFGAGLVWLRPWWAVGASLVSVLVIAFLSCSTVWQTHVWFAWMYITGLQIPVSLAWSLFTHTRRLGREKAYLEETLSQTLREVEETKRARDRDAGRPSSAPAQEQAQDPGTPSVADHTLIRRVGKGGYGEVWLARNAIGLYHVVKLVYRKDFNDDDPYEREFKGIQKFMPISRSHPGFVNILQVGRNNQTGFFYYVMEAGDDEKTGQKIDPQTYAPKTLGTALKEAGALPAQECVRLGLALTHALDALHQHGLIHRDIKPANIIYVHGDAKLADIGLVTDIQATGLDVSLLGTEGYIAPEGPGTPSADVYSLGKVLYEACMGLDRRRFPELPTALYDAADITERMQLNKIILRACEPSPEDRYRTAAEMRAELQDLANQIRPKK